MITAESVFLSVLAAVPKCAPSRGKKQRNVAQRTLRSETLRSISMHGYNGSLLFQTVSLQPKGWQVENVHH